MKKLIPILFLIPFFANANSAKELAKYAMLENIDVWISNGKSSVSSEIPTYSASSLINEFDDNEFSYTEKHDKKPVRIQTVVSGVKMDLSKKPYIQANGKNQFEYVSLYAADKNDLAKLKKGQKIDMVCKGTDKNIMGVVLVNCLFTKDYSDLIMDNVAKRLDREPQEIKYFVDVFYGAINSVLGDSKSPITGNMTEKEKIDATVKWMYSNADQFKTERDKIKAANPDIDFKNLPLINLP